MIQHYWVSTPRFTCWVAIDTAHQGKIIDCAPYLRKRWRGRLWVSLVAQMTMAYEDTFRYEPIPCSQETP